MQTNQWSSRIGFILASAGSAIGLGAIWKLPYMTGMNGGGAFILLFVLFSFFIGFPLLLSEFIIGKTTQQGAIGAYKSIAPNEKWHYIGYMGIFTNFLLLSFYSVIGGWIIQYCFVAIKQLISPVVISYDTYFNDLVSSPFLVLLGQGIFLLITVVVVAKGVQEGIEKASKYLMPTLFIIFFIIIIRSVTLDGAMEGVKFFLKPSFSSITSEGVLYAMGQSFFSLSVGVSTMVTYSSYLSRKENILTPAFSVVTMNLFISILAGLAIFPAVFSLGYSPEQGPGLIFIVLPNVFSQIIFGDFIFLLFILLFLFATLTSAFSMLEIIVASLTQGKNEKRKVGSYGIGLAIFVLGIPSALSFSVLAEWKLFNLSFFDFADFLVSNILLPLGALFISIFVAHRMDKVIMKSEFINSNRYSLWFYKVWYFLIKYVVPLVIIYVFLNSTGILK